MDTLRLISEDIYYVGASSRNINLFENIFPINNGASFNSYLICDEKTALLDTCDNSVAPEFFSNLETTLNGRKLDYLIVNHMEPDHCSQINNIRMRYPNIIIVGNSKTFAMMKQFFGELSDDNKMIVKEGDCLSLGKHTLTFVMAPMVHWPEVMVTYDKTSKTLFSADAFGTFGALNGNIFADEIDFNRDWLPEARRYYSNIVGKYGSSVNMLLKKASTLDIKTICPLHGPIFRENLDRIINIYLMWANYKAEEKVPVIFYATMYGNTEHAANSLAAILAEKGVQNIKLYDVSITDVSYLISEIFRASHLVFACPTYNAEIHPKMANLLDDMKNLNVQNKMVSVIENGSWAPTAGNKIIEKLTLMRNMTVVGDKLTINSSLNEISEDNLSKLAENIYNSLS